MRTLTAIALIASLGIAGCVSALADTTALGYTPAGNYAPTSVEADVDCDRDALDWGKCFMDALNNPDSAGGDESGDAGAGGDGGDGGAGGP